MSQDVVGGRLHADVVADTTGLARELQAKIDAETRNVRARIRAEIDTRGLRAEVKAAAQEASRQQKVRINAELDSSSLIREAQEAAAVASRTAKVRIGTEIDADGLGASIESELTKISARHKIHLQVEADTGRARAEIEALRREAARPVSMPVSSGGGASGASKGADALGKTIMEASKLPAIIGLIFALGSAAIQAGAGLFAMASSASQAFVALAALPNVIGVVVQAAAGLFAAFSGLGGGIQALMKQQQGAATTARQSARSQVASAQQIAAAQHALGQAEQQRADDAKQAGFAISDAEWSVTRAQKAAKQAQTDLNKAREQARADIKALRDELQRSVLDEKEAANNLAKAKQHLQDVRWDASSTAQERKDARLAVQEAEQQYKDAKKHREDTKKATDDAVKKGVKGSDVVKQALDAQVVANHNLMLAERDLQQTRHRNAEQAANDAYAVKQAQQALANAHKSAADSAIDQAAANSTLLSAYDKLTPAGQRFAKFIVDTVLPRLKDIRNDAQEALLPPLQEGIRRALPLLDVFDKGLVGTDKVLGRLFLTVGTLFGSKGFGRDVGKIMTNNNRALGILARGVRPLINMFRDLAVVAGPHLLIPFAKWVTKLIEAASAAVHTGRETGTLADRFDRARKVARILGDIVANIAGALHGMGKAATPAGNDLLRTFEKVTKRWDTWANSKRGQKQMRTYFESIKPVTDEVGRLIVNLSKFLIVTSGAGGGVIGGFVKTLNIILIVLTKIMGLPVIGGGIAALLTLAGVGGALGFAAGSVLRVYGGLAKLAKLTGLSKMMLALRESTLGVNIQVGILAAQEAIASAATAAWASTMEFLGLATKGAFIQFTVAIAIVAALVGGFILLYKHVGWFHDAVDAVVHAVVGAFKWLWDVLFGHSIIPDIMAGFQAFFDFTKKVFGWIGDVVHVLAGVFTWLWQHIVQPYFDLMGKAIGLYWNYYAKPIFKLIVGAVRVLGAVFTWLWQHAVKPAWSAIQAAVKVAWNDVLKPYLKLIRLELRVLGAVFTWLWQHAVKPAWDAITSAVRWGWRNIIKPDLNLLSKALNAVGGVFTWLWRNAVKPAWNALTGAVSDGWNHVIKPVFQALSDFVTQHVKPAFKKAVDGLTDIWNGLASAAQKPVNFLVNTLYNDGIRKVINLIPGIPDLAALKVNFKFAEGGVLPGYTPGKDVHKFVSPGSGMTLDLSGGEAFMRPEWTRLIGGPSVVRMLNAAARGGKAALRRAMGAVAGLGDTGVNRAGQASFASGGVIPQASLQQALTFAQAQVGKPYTWGAAGPNGFDCSGFMSAITNVILGYKNPYFRRGSTGTFPWSGFKSGFGQFTIGSTPQYPGSSVGHMAGTIVAGNKGYNVESRGGVGPIVGPQARGFNDKGFRTWGHLGTGVSGFINSALKGGGGPGILSIIKQIKSLIGKVPGMIHTLGSLGGDWGKMLSTSVHGVGGKFRNWVNDKVWGPGPIPGGIFDTGGFLNPGLTLAYNGTGRREHVLTHEQAGGLAGVVQRLITNTSNTSNGGSLVGALSLSVGSADDVPQVFDDLDHELRILRLGGASDHSTAD